MVLVIYANIHVVGLMPLSSEFQTSSTMAWQGQEDVEPFKMLRTWIGKSSRLYSFGLVIQDHIESIGKPILLRGDEVLIMIYLSWE